LTIQSASPSLGIILTPPGEYLYEKDQIRDKVWIITKGKISVLQKSLLPINTISLFPAALAFSSLFVPEHPATTSLLALEPLKVFPTIVGTVIIAP